MPDDADAIVIDAPNSPEEFDDLMFRIGEERRAIDELELNRNKAVANIDKPYKEARAPHERLHDAMFDVAMAYASDPANKGRITTSKSPQTANLVHSVVKFTEDHSGTIELADGITEDQAIRALRHIKGGGLFYKTTRSLIWGVLRAKTNENTVLALSYYFVRKFAPIKVTLYVKPATTPKPGGKVAELKIARYH